MFDFWFGLPRWLRIVFAPGVLTYPIYLMQNGIIWLWAWAVGGTLLVLSILKPLGVPQKNEGHQMADLDRFPALPAVQAQLGALVRVRHTLRQGPATAERDQALAHNARQLAAWGALSEALGGLGEEEGGRDDLATRAAALGRLRAMLGDADWKAGRMP